MPAQKASGLLLNVIAIGLPMCEFPNYHSAFASDLRGDSANLRNCWQQIERNEPRLAAQEKQIAELWFALVIRAHDLAIEHGGTCLEFDIRACRARL